MYRYCDYIVIITLFSIGTRILAVTINIRMVENNDRCSDFNTIRITVM